MSVSPSSPSFPPFPPLRVSPLSSPSLALLPSPFLPPFLLLLFLHTPLLSFPLPRDSHALLLSLLVLSCPFSLCLPLTHGASLSLPFSVSLSLSLCLYLRLSCPVSLPLCLSLAVCVPVSILYSSTPLPSSHDLFYIPVHRSLTVGKSLSVSLVSVTPPPLSLSSPPSVSSLLSTCHVLFRCLSISLLSLHISSSPFLGPSYRLGPRFSSEG